MGKKDAIKRIKEYIQKYVDIDLDNGQSILHIYPLQFLKALNFAPVLSQIVASQGGSSSIGAGLYGGTSGQSTGSTNPTPGQQFFKGVRVTFNAAGIGVNGANVAPFFTVALPGKIRVSTS